MIKAAIAIAVAVVVLLAALLFSQSRHEPFKVSGFIEADEIRVGSRVGGRTARVLVVEGQRVKPGEVLVELEPYDLRERRAQAAGELAARQADAQRLANGPRPEEIAQGVARRDRLAAVLNKLRTGPRKQEIAAAESNVNLAQAQLDWAQTNFNRTKPLFESHAASELEMNKAIEDLKVAKATVSVRHHELDLLREGTRPEEIAEAEAQLAEAEQALKLLQNGYRAEEKQQARAAVEAAAAAVRVVDEQIRELTIKSPGDAIVEALDLQPGDLAAANAPVLSLLDTNSLWVRAYVPENRLDVRIGQHVAVTVDSFPGRRFPARVTFVSRQAEFTPNNVQTPEERSKQVFRIKVSLENTADRDVLRPGMAADVWLEGKDAGPATVASSEPAR